MDPRTVSLESMKRKIKWTWQVVFIYLCAHIQTYMHYIISIGQRKRSCHCESRRGKPGFKLWLLGGLEEKREWVSNVILLSNLKHLNNS